MFTESEIKELSNRHSRAVGCMAIAVLHPPERGYCHVQEVGQADTNVGPSVSAYVMAHGESQPSGVELALLRIAGKFRGGNYVKRIRVLRTFDSRKDAESFLSKFIWQDPAYWNKAFAELDAKQGVK